MANTVKTITFTPAPASGTIDFSITLLGYAYTATTAYDASAATIQTALQTAIGSGNVTVTGTAATAIVLTFAGDLANVNVETVTATPSDGASTPSVADTTAGTDRLSTWYWCAVKTRDAIRALALPSIPSASVVIQKQPYDRHFGSGQTYAYPGIIVCPLGVAQTTPAAGSNRRDDVGYPVRVVVVEADNQDLTITDLNRHLSWQERLSKLFRNQKITGLPDVYTVRMEPGETGPWAEWMGGKYVTGMVLRFVNRETRGAA